MNSMACSRFSMRGGTSRMASSAVDARMLVSFFSLTMFTSRSASRAFSPTIMPSYTSVPGATKISPRSLALQHGPGGEPRRQAGRQYVKPDQRVVERQTEHRQEHHVRNGNCREHRNLANGKRHRQPKVVQLIQPLLNSPDTGVGGQIHQTLSFRPLRQALRCSELLSTNERQVRARFPWQAIARFPARRSEEHTSELQSPCNL